MSEKNRSYEHVVRTYLWIDWQIVHFCNLVTVNWSCPLLVYLIIPPHVAAEVGAGHDEANRISTQASTPKQLKMRIHQFQLMYSIWPLLVPLRYERFDWNSPRSRVFTPLIHQALHDVHHNHRGLLGHKFVLPNQYFTFSGQPRRLDLGF